MDTDVFRAFAAEIDRLITERHGHDDEDEAKEKGESVGPPSSSSSAGQSLPSVSS